VLRTARLSWARGVAWLGNQCAFSGFLALRIPRPHVHSPRSLPVGSLKVHHNQLTVVPLTSALPSCTALELLNMSVCGLRNIPLAVRWGALQTGRHAWHAACELPTCILLVMQLSLPGCMQHPGPKRPCIHPYFRVVVYQQISNRCNNISAHCSSLPSPTWPSSTCTARSAALLRQDWQIGTLCACSLPSAS